MSRAEPTPADEAVRRVVQDAIDAHADWLAQHGAIEKDLAVRIMDDLSAAGFEVVKRPIGPDSEPTSPGGAT